MVFLDPEKAQFFPFYTRSLQPHPGRNCTINTLLFREIITHIRHSCHMNRSYHVYQNFSGSWRAHFPTVTQLQSNRIFNKIFTTTKIFLMMEFWRKSFVCLVLCFFLCFYYQLIANRKQIKPNSREGKSLVLIN